MPRFVFLHHTHKGRGFYLNIDAIFTIAPDESGERYAGSHLEVNKADVNSLYRVRETPAEIMGAIIIAEQNGDIVGS